MSFHSIVGNSVDVDEIRYLELGGGFLSPRTYQNIQNHRAGSYSVDNDFSISHRGRELEGLCEIDGEYSRYSQNIFSQRQGLRDYIVELLTSYSNGELSNFQINSDTIELLNGIKEGSLEIIYMDLLLSDLGEGHIFQDIGMEMNIRRETDLEKKGQMEQELATRIGERESRRVQSIQTHLLLAQSRLRVGGILVNMNYASVPTYCGEDFFESELASLERQNADQDDRWISPFGLYDYCCGGRKEITVEQFRKIK